MAANRLARGATGEEAAAADGSVSFHQRAVPLLDFSLTEAEGFLPGLMAAGNGTAVGITASAIDPDGDEDEEYEKKVMTIAHKENCVGCEACSKVCPKKCYTHEAAQV